MILFINNTWVAYDKLGSLGYQILDKSDNVGANAFCINASNNVSSIGNMSDNLSQTGNISDGHTTTYAEFSKVLLDGLANTYTFTLTLSKVCFLMGILSFCGGYLAWILRKK
jgi:hypothetical protein